LRRDFGDIEWLGVEQFVHKQCYVTQILDTRTGHEPSNMLKVGVEGGQQHVPVADDRVGRFTYSILHVKQPKNLRQSTASSAKLAVLPPACAGSVTSYRIFIRLGDTQPALAEPSEKPGGHANIPPNGFEWILLLVERLGDKRQVLRRRP
jgi:hypothetical protein